MAGQDADPLKGPQEAQPIQNGTQEDVKRDIVNQSFKDRLKQGKKHKKHKALVP